MRDDVTFETRLADALGRFADLAPTMDDEAIAQHAIESAGSTGRLGWLGLPRRGGIDREGGGQLGLRLAYLLLILGLVLAALLVAIAAGVLRTDRPRPLGRNGAIAFTLQGNDHGPASTHLIDPDGTGDRSIDTDRCPTYSKDGGVLTSLSYDGSASLVVWGADGRPAGTVLLVENPPTSVSYALSPDGTRVAWFKPASDVPAASQAPDGSFATSGTGTELWVAPIAGGPGTRVQPASSVPDEFYEAPLWSPDSRSIAFGGYIADPATGIRQRSAIFVVAADGTGLLRLSDRPAILDDAMSWSPDGRFLAYVGLPDAPPGRTPAPTPATAVYPARDLFVIGADGTGEQRVTDTPAFETRPEWSPDGAVLAFESSPDGADGRVTTIEMHGPSPGGPARQGPESPWFVWSPDGAALLWLEANTIGTEAYRSTLHSIDPAFQQSPTTLQAMDGLIVCPPSWQRLEP